jgi:Dolichyl-phosphate-mannose-protein mannosyltransferase
VVVLSPEDAAEERTSWWPARLPRTMCAAMAVALLWFVIELGPFVGEAPDFDAMVALRESLVLFQQGFHGLIASADGTGIHPPLADALNFLAFSLFGADPRSQQLMSVVLFLALAAFVERLVAPWLGPVQRVLAALVVVICPSLAISLFFVSREGLLMVILAGALLVTLAPGVPRRPLFLGCVLALMPLAKETGIALIAPFAVYMFFTGGGTAEDRLVRVVWVAGIPILVALIWRAVLAAAGGSPWHTWVLSDHADDGPYIVAIRAMLGLEKGIYLRQNLANAFIVNYLWLPAALALASVVLVVRNATRRQRRAVALLCGIAVVYAWTTLTFPTFTEPRYAAPLTMVTLLIVLFSLPSWPRVARGIILGALLFAFAAGAWAPTDPISRSVFGTVSVGGEQIYNTAELQRGPDRMNINFAVLRASHRVNERLRRIFRTDATLVTGDCNAMKFGEKLFTVGFTPSAYDRGIPGARPLKCVLPQDLPPGAADGSDHLVLVRTPEEDARNDPLAVTGRAVIVIR